MKFYVGLADEDWIRTLKSKNTTIANYWKPGSKKRIAALKPGDLFLFKSHVAAGGKIVGCGSFVKYERLSINQAWKTYGDANGCNSLSDMKSRVERYRKRSEIANTSSNIGCIILSNLVFFDEAEYIAPPADWNKAPFPGKTYSTDDKVGFELYVDVCRRLRRIAQAGLVALSWMSQFGGLTHLV